MKLPKGRTFIRKTRYRIEIDIGRKTVCRSARLHSPAHRSGRNLLVAHGEMAQAELRTREWLPDVGHLGKPARPEEETT